MLYQNTAALLKWLQAITIVAMSQPLTLGEEPGSFRPPSVPLVPHDPYFSIWSPHDRLTDGDTTHWTSTPQPLRALIRIDGRTHRLMGTARDVPALPQTALAISATRTTATFQNENVNVQITFFTPALPGELDVLARPLTYIEWAARSVDGQAHDLRLYFEADGSLACDTTSQALTWSEGETAHTRWLKIGTTAQPVLMRQGDNLRIDWGYAYLAVDEGQTQGLTLKLGEAESARTAFASQGSIDQIETPAPPRTVREGAPALVACWDLGKVDGSGDSRRLMLAYDDEWSIRYFDSRLRPYWRRGGWDAPRLLDAAAGDHARLSRLALAFDQELEKQSREIGGEGYARLAALAYRQTLAGCKLTADAAGQPLLFPKENFSNGCIGTVDVIYPMAPFTLLFSPALTRAMLVPVLDYAASPRWKFDYAPHDLGRYPHATGQVYGGGERSDARQMPVEESANMILLVAAACRAEGNASLADRYWPLLQKWARYLEAKGFDPENQLCTDDFAGHLAHNVNLSAKAICALGAYAQLCRQRGDSDSAKRVASLANQFTQRWLKEAREDGHFRLAFDRPGTWSQKYNLIWDRVLELGLFPAEVVQQEMAYYRKVQNPHGLPLDSRSTYTKLDWILWTACLTGRREDFDALVQPVLKFLNETPDRVPMTDWYFTDSARQRGFQARPVVGGVFIPFLTDAPGWRSWVARGARSAGPWAPLPLRQHKSLAPTSEAASITWRWTVEPPTGDLEWTSPSFDAKGWATAAGGSGAGDRNDHLPVGLNWPKGVLRLRREFEVDEVPTRPLILRISHTHQVRIYINGVLAADVRGELRGYENYPVHEQAASVIKPGRNVLAVIAIPPLSLNVRKYIDAGLYEE